jgi:hypothetical protein
MKKTKAHALWRKPFHFSVKALELERAAASGLLVN